MDENDEIGKELDEVELENLNMKKKIENLKIQLNEEIDSNNKVNKEADDLYEELMKYKELYENLLKKDKNEINININEKKEELLNDDNKNNNENNKNEISKSNINDKARIDYTQNENEDDDNNKNENIININIKKYLEEDFVSIDKSGNDEKDLMINNLKNEIEKLNKELKDIKEESENEIKGYKLQLHEEKNINFVLQKKIKDLNMKVQLKTIEEITKNGKININNNINNININFKNKNNLDENGLKSENSEKINITPHNFEIIKEYQLKERIKK